MCARAHIVKIDCLIVDKSLIFVLGLIVVDLLGLKARKRVV